MCATAVLTSKWRSGAGMVNSWLWQTDMSGPETSVSTASADEAGGGNGPLFSMSPGEDAEANALPYPRVGKFTSEKRSFRDLVREHRKRN